MLLSGTNLMLAFPRQPFFFFITNLDTGDATRSGFIKGNLGEAGVMFAGLLWGFFAYFMWGIDVLGLRDLSADLTIVLSDKCIDSCGTCFVPTLLVIGSMSVPLTTKSNKCDNIRVSMRFIL